MCELYFSLRERERQDYEGSGPWVVVRSTLNSVPGQIPVKTENKCCTNHLRREATNSFIDLHSCSLKVPEVFAPGKTYWKVMGSVTQIDRGLEMRNKGHLSG